MKEEIRSIDEIERGQLTSPFGRDLGLIHELLVQGRKQNVGRAFWRLLHENEEVFRMAIEAALNFPTHVCSLKDISQPTKKLLNLCAQATKEFTSDGFHLCFDGKLEPDEIDDITYDTDTLPISLFPVSRETGLRDLEQQIAGLYFRPARLKEMLLLAHQHRNTNWPSTIFCLQKAHLGKQEVRVYLTTRHPRSLPEYSIRINEDVTTKDFVIYAKEDWTVIPVVRLPRIPED